MINTILCFDLGTKMGWAIRGADGGITSGTVDFKSRRFEGGGMRYLRFKRWLTDIKQAAGQIDAVYFERGEAPYWHGCSACLRWFK